jgi:hypothetical protein
LVTERLKTRKRVIERLSRDDERYLIWQAYKEKGEQSLLIKTLFQTDAQVFKFSSICVKGFFFETRVILMIKIKESKSI